jgi:hypothetical protein
LYGSYWRCFWASIKFFAYWIFFAFGIPGSWATKAVLASVFSWVCALAAALFLWRVTRSIVGPRGALQCAVFGALLAGGIGFAGGFFGPILFDPGSNQGPLLGIFLTAPLGLVVGAVGGAVYGAAQRRDGEDGAPH